MARKELSLTLPWPPSSNTYWRRNGARYFISNKGQEYRKIVLIKTLPFKDYFHQEERLSLFIKAYPPDKRKRDLDNLFKGVLDSLQFAKVFQDDNQIDILFIQRMPGNDGKIEITINEI